MALLLFAVDNQVVYDDYKSMLRTTRLTLVAKGLICVQAVCYGNYRGRLKITRVLW